MFIFEDYRALILCLYLKIITYSYCKCINAQTQDRIQLKPYGIKVKTDVLKSTLIAKEFISQIVITL